MKRVRTLITICLLVAATTLFAQTESRQLLAVQIPFNFSVGNNSLPAGAYNIFTVLPERAIRITSADGRHAAIVKTLPTYSSSPSVNSRLVFDRYGNEYFLTLVWVLGEDVARNPILSERATQLASKSSFRQTTTVAAKLSHR